MTHSTLSSLRLEPESTFLELSSSILSQLSLTKSVPEHTDNSSTQNSSSLERKMPPTTTPVVTTPSERKLSTTYSTVFASWPTTVPVSKVSWYSTPSVVVLDPVSVLSSWNVSLSTTERSPSSSSQYTQLLRYLLQWLSLTTLS